MRHDLETVVSYHTPIIDKVQKMETNYINSLDTVLDEYQVSYTDKHEIYECINSLVQIKDCLRILEKENN